MQLLSLRDLLLHELKELRYVEECLLEALPQMSTAANNEELTTAFSDHLVETREQLTRLDEIDALMGQAGVGAAVDEPMDVVTQDSVIDRLIQDGQKIIQSSGDPTVKDAALIAAGQKVEHYEIALYGCAVAHARALDLGEVQSLLEDTLSEEEDADSKLSFLAEGNLFVQGINEEAGEETNS